MTGFLVLEDGTVFRGESVAAAGTAFGEAVFTTAMTGYQEVVTDPSYAGQIVAFTAPMIGNYGVAESRSESERPHAAAVVMREARGPEWTKWLRGFDVPALTGIDTRALVLHLREPSGARARQQARARDEPEPRLCRRADGEPCRDARVALRRHSRRPLVPGAARALGAVPSRGRAGPARRVVDPRRLGRGGASC